MNMKAVFCFYLLIFITISSICQAAITDEKPLNHPQFGFIENKGQIIDQNNKPNPAVLYLLNTPGMNVQLRKGGFSYDLYQESRNPEFRNFYSEPGTRHPASNIQHPVSPHRHRPAECQPSSNHWNIWYFIRLFELLYHRNTYWRNYWCPVICHNHL